MIHLQDEPFATSACYPACLWFVVDSSAACLIWTCRPHAMNETVTPTMDARALREEAERVRASMLLGRSGSLLRLFDFLLERTLAGMAAKEIEVAVSVFGKSSGSDLSQDSSVRVYVHKLRRRLDDYYSRSGPIEGPRLIIPKGEYRLSLEEPAQAVPHETAPASTPLVQRNRRWLPWSLLAAMALNVVLLALLMRAQPHIAKPADSLDPVRSSGLWKPFADPHPIIVVVGDYFIFGETDDAMNVRRLVREFDINSRGEFDNFVKAHPRESERYIDLDLTYLPRGAAFALRDVLPVLSSPAFPAERIRVVPASELTADMIKSANIVYVGYISGLGMLREIVFRDSRFAPSESDDELVDRQTQTHYISQAGMPLKATPEYADYGYVSSFPGPAHNRILIICGTRDVALMQTAEAVTNLARIDELLTRSGSSDAFEGLYEVSGLDRVNLRGRLLSASALNGTDLWRGRRQPR